MRALTKERFRLAAALHIANQNFNIYNARLGEVVEEFEKTPRIFWIKRRFLKWEIDELVEKASDALELQEELLRKLGGH